MLRCPHPKKRRPLSPIIKSHVITPLCTSLVLVFQTKRLIHFAGPVISWCFLFACFLNSNILKLMNAFNYPENNITQSNYDQVLSHLNQTSPDIIQGLNLRTCDMQFFLSQVGKFIYKTNRHRDMMWHVVCSASGCWGNRFGLHRVHGSHHQDASISSMGRPLLHHALLSRSLNHVWECWGSCGSFAGSWSAAQEVAQRSFYWYFSFWCIWVLTKSEYVSQQRD